MLPAVVLAGIALLLLAVTSRGAHTALTGTCLTIGIVLGGWSGTSMGGSSRKTCAAELLTGDPVFASGIVVNRARTGAGTRRILRLTEANILKGGQNCPVGGLMIRVAGRNANPGPGSYVSVRGEWMKLAGSGRWPTRPERQGLVTGIMTKTESGRGLSWTIRIRSALANRLARRLPSDVAPTALALVLAERDELDPDLRRRFASAGLAHLLAISGMHVGLMAAGMV